jgi:uncharacterized protein (DUF1697 family)
VTTYVALLRGINLGNHNKISMRELEAVCAGVGWDVLALYLRSGNVVFDATRAKPDELGDALADALAAERGYDVPTLVRTAREMSTIASSNPLLAKGADPERCHVTFLHDVPSKAKVAAIDPAEGRGDEFAVVKREVYLHCPNGYGRSRLVNPFWERRLAMTATTRNWRTVNALVEMAGD